MNKETAIAFARLIVTLAVTVATAFGWALDTEVVLNITLSALSVICLCWTWWKNNNVTESAQEAQGVLDALKDGTFAELQSIEEAVRFGGDGEEVVIEKIEVTE